VSSFAFCMIALRR